MSIFIVLIVTWVVLRVAFFLWDTGVRVIDSVTVTEQTLPKARPINTTDIPADAHDIMGAKADMIRRQLGERVARFRDIADDPVTTLRHPDFYPQVWSIVGDIVDEAEGIMLADVAAEVDSIAAVDSWAHRVCVIADALDIHADALLDDPVRAGWGEVAIDRPTVRAVANIDVARCRIKDPVTRAEAARAARRTAAELHPELDEHIERAFGLLDATITADAYRYYAVK